MSDKELLKLAAKAAGIKGSVMGCGAMVCEKDGVAFWWDPLTDDGDALRLAMRLRLSIAFEVADVGCIVSVYAEWEGAPDSPFVEDFEGGVSAATRRAIVRAAAEIGKAQGFDERDQNG